MAIWDVCLTHDPVYGGIHRSVNNFARALDAGILSFDDGAAARSGLREPRPVVRVPCRPRPLNRACHWMSPGMAAEAARAVAGADLLVVHSLFRAHATWAARWCREHGKPYVAVLHGCLDPWGLRQRSFAKRAWLAARGRPFFAGASRVIAATTREKAKAAAWVPADRLTVIHWPVELPSLAGRDAARQAFRAARGIPADARVLLFVGRLHPMKRPGHMVEAFVRAAGPACHLVVAGPEEGVTIISLRSLVPSDAIARVHFVGRLTGAELTAAHAAADGFVSLSHRENFGYAFAEALAYGLPAIVSPGHDLADDIATGSSGRFPAGWLLPDDSLATAVGAIGEFATLPPSRLAEMGAVGRAWVADHLSYERFRHEVCKRANHDIALSRNRFTASGTKRFHST